MGYMASGKSLVGRELSKKLKYNFMDLDDYIEDSEARSISKLFEKKGEIYFRRKEAESLKTVLNNYGKLVLSLGGGTPCYGNNLDSISRNPNTTSIYLKSSIPTIVSRVKNEKQKRPLIAHLKTNDELVEFIGKHLFERSQFYSQADHTIVTDDLTVDQIVEQIVLKLY